MLKDTISSGGEQHLARIHGHGRQSCIHLYEGTAKIWGYCSLLCFGSPAYVSILQSFFISIRKYTNCEESSKPYIVMKHQSVSRAGVKWARLGVAPSNPQVYA